ncbi:hypothetical protein [Luteococcus sp.]
MDTSSPLVEKAVEWEGCTAGPWQEAIDVRDFIQRLHPLRG